MGENDIQINISYDDEIYLDDSFRAQVSVPEDATGDMSFFIDDEEQYYDYCDEGSYYYSVVLDKFGDYVFKALYTAGEDDLYLDGVKEITYHLANDRYIMSLSDTAYSGDVAPELRAPFLEMENIVLTLNGKKYNATYDGTMGIYTFAGADWKYGENEINLY